MVLCDEYDAGKTDYGTIITFFLGRPHDRKGSDNHAREFPGVYLANETTLSFEGSQTIMERKLNDVVELPEALDNTLIKNVPT